MTDPRPWFADERPRGDARQHAPATARNRDAILSVLRAELAADARVLEIASGSGEHALFFARALPNVAWQPSDTSDAALASIAAWREEGAPANLAPAIRIDVMRDDDWPQRTFDALFVANLTHIAPFAAMEALFAGADRALSPEGRALLYGPFFRDDAPPSEGDVGFDAALRARDPALGIRHVDAVDAAAAGRGFRRVAAHAMPANNLTLVYARL